jgi:hypothetical protein
LVWTVFFISIGCALIAAGCGIEWASRYVGVSARTIRREVLRNEDFYEQLRRAELSAQLNPLKALQNATGTHWRAAAWLLERTCPERFAKPDLKRYDQADLQEIFAALLEEINQAIPDARLCLQVYHRLTGFFQAKLQELWSAKTPRRRFLNRLAHLQATADNNRSTNSGDSNTPPTPTPQSTGQNPPESAPPPT